MSSRLQAFATRNHKQDVDRAAIAETARLSRRDVRLRQTRASKEPTLLDTDVESIGDSTTFSLADADQASVGDNGYQSSLIAARFQRNGPQREFQIGAESTMNAGLSGASIEENPLLQITQPSQEDYPYQYGKYHARAKKEAAKESIQVLEHNLLDTASILPDSPTQHGADRDRSPNSVGDSVSATPRRLRQQAARKASPPRAAALFGTGSRKRVSDPPYDMTPKHAKAKASYSSEAQSCSSSTVLTNPPDAISASASQNASIPSHPTTPTLDHDIDTLAAMPFSQLAAEPFDLNPANAPYEASASVNELDADELLNRLRAIATGPGTATQQAAERRALFAALTLPQHEQAGALVLREFTAVAERLQEVRRRKRAAAEELEGRVAARAAAVEAREAALARRMGWLRKQGEGVVRGPE